MDDTARAEVAVPATVYVTPSGDQDMVRLVPTRARRSHTGAVPDGRPAGVRSKCCVAEPPEIVAAYTCRSVPSENSSKRRKWVASCCMTRPCDWNFLVGT